MGNKLNDIIISLDVWYMYVLYLEFIENKHFANEKNVLCTRVESNMYTYNKFALNATQESFLM